MNTNLALQLAILLLQQGTALATVVRKAVEEGRQDLTEEELDEIVGKDEASRARFQAQIDAIKA